MCKAFTRLLAALSGAALLASCSRDNAEGAGKSAPPMAMPPVPVTVATVEQKDVPVQITAIGTVQPYATVSIKTRIDGQLAPVSFKEGDAVRKGDLLFTIEPRFFEVALAEAQANMARDAAMAEKAEADRQRTDELAGTKAVSAATVDLNRAEAAAARASVEADKAAVERAKVNLSYCYIHSQIDGRIGKILLNAGNVVKNNDAVLAVINQIKPIYVDFSVPEQQLAEIRARMAAEKLPVEAAIPQRNDLRATGELRLINNEVDSRTGTISLRAEFANENEMLWPGQFMNVHLTLAVRHNAMVVPSEAIQISQQGRYVFVVKGNTVESRPVIVGDKAGQETVVEQGLQAGERVVTSGQLRLMDGAKVEIKAPEVTAPKKS